MNPSEYTPDSICHAMGLVQFVETSWTSPALRLLLKPSFHPEVCISISDNKLQVVACREMLWRRLCAFPVTTFRDHASLRTEQIRELCTSQQLAAASQDERMICLDGMPVASYSIDEQGIVRFEDNPYRDESRDFVAKAIDLAWHSCSDPCVKNALADCGRYVSLKLPACKVPDPLPEFNIAVVGTKGDRSNLLADIEQRTNTK